MGPRAQGPATPRCLHPPCSSAAAPSSPYRKTLPPAPPPPTTRGHYLIPRRRHLSAGFSVGAAVGAVARTCRQGSTLGRRWGVPPRGRRCCGCAAAGFMASAPRPRPPPHPAAPPTVGPGGGRPAVGAAHGEVGDREGGMHQSERPPAAASQAGAPPLLWPLGPGGTAALSGPLRPAPCPSALPPLYPSPYAREQGRQVDCAKGMALTLHLPRQCPNPPAHNCKYPPDNPPTNSPCLSPPDPSAPLRRAPRSPLLGKPLKQPEHLCVALNHFVQLLLALFRQAPLGRL